ncbi:MAG TPA: flagellar basal-body rod protein FlgG [bacterium]|nr:flagellar basal-body rod protein FlgG [bacterium]
MMRALWTASTGMGAQQLKIDVISNNLANVNTIGFKRSRADFQDLLYQTMRAPGTPNATGQPSPGGIQLGLGVRTSQIQAIFQAGDLQQTQNELDVAIEGDGFFQVQLPNGELAYTRAGNFRRNADGAIVTPDGYLVQPEVSIPSDATSITIGQDGTVSVIRPGQTEEEEIGTVQLARFTNPSGLRSMGRNLLYPTSSSGDATLGTAGDEGFGTLAQGFIEMSNVNLVEEMVNMIVGQRAYEISSKVITTADAMLQAAGAVAR